MQGGGEPVSAVSRRRWLAVLLVILLVLDGYFLFTALKSEGTPVPLTEDVPKPIPLLYSPYVYLDTVTVTEWVAQYEDTYYYLAVGADGSVHAITANDPDRLRADLEAQNPLRLYGTVSTVSDGLYGLISQSLDLSVEETKQLIGGLCLHPYFSPSRSQWQRLALTGVLTAVTGISLFTTWRRRDKQIRK